MFRNRLIAAGFALALVPSATPQTPANPAAATLPPETPLVIDGPVTVDAADFEGNILRIPEEKRGGFRLSYDRVAAVVDNVFITRSVAQKARDAGLDRDPAVQARLRQLQDGFLADLYMKKLERDAQATDLEVRAREIYLADQDQFMADEEVRMQQILVGVKCRTKDAALELARKAREEALSSDDFLAVAKKYSDEGVKSEKGGDLGLSPVKAFVPEVREAVAKMKKGEISEPVESPFGYHVFKLLDRKPPQKKPFEAVKKELVEAQKAKLARNRLDATIAEVRSSKTVTIYGDNVAKLVAAGGDVDELSRKAREAAQRAANSAAEKQQQAPEAK